MVMIAISIFMSIPFYILFDGILTLQIVSHLPLFDFNLPLSALNFMVWLNRIVSFNLIDKTAVDFVESRSLYTNFEWLKYDTGNFYENLGFISIIAIIIFSW